MAMAINLINGESSKTHSGTFNLFSRQYIATEILTKEEGSLYRRLFTMRQTGDYDDLFDWEEENVAPLIPDVEAFIEKLKNICFSAL